MAKTKNTEKTPSSKERPQNKNLHRINKGEPSPNPNGRPKGILNFKTRLKMAIDDLAHKYVADHNRKPINKNKQIKFEDVDIMGDIFNQYLNKSRNGNDRVLIHLVEMAYGKPKQGVELSGALGSESLEQQKKRQEEADKEIDEWESMWTGQKTDYGNSKTNKRTKTKDNKK